MVCKYYVLSEEAWWKSKLCVCVHMHPCRVQIRESNMDSLKMSTGNGGLYIPSLSMS